MDYTKLESGRVKIQPKSFDLKVLINGVMKLFEINVKQKELDFKVEYIGDIPQYVVGDGGRLRQVLTNLVGNSIKFTNEGSIIIRLTLLKNHFQEKEIKFEVIDTGIGIEKSKLCHIFERFYQGQDSVIREYGGSGLGLTISSELVGLMGETLECESEVGKGSQFKFMITFKLSEIDKTELNPVNVMNPTRKYDGVKVLVADDDPISLKMMTKLFHKYGFIVETVSNGIEVMNTVSHESFDIIFMDIGMPIMDGLSATKLIRKMEVHRGTHIPIIAMTAFTLEGDKEKFLSEGLDDYISKPIDLSNILDMINKWIE